MLRKIWGLWESVVSQNCLKQYGVCHKMFRTIWSQNVTENMRSAGPSKYYVIILGPIVQFIVVHQILKLRKRKCAPNLCTNEIVGSPQKSKLQISVIISASFSFPCGIFKKLYATFNIQRRSFFLFVKACVYLYICS